MAYNVTDTTVTVSDRVPFVVFDDAKIRRRVVSGAWIQFPHVARRAQSPIWRRCSALFKTLEQTITWTLA